MLHFSPTSLTSQLSSVGLKGLLIGLLFTCITACSTLQIPPPQAGEPESAILARYGQAHARYGLDGETFLEYNSWPFGRQTHIAHLGRDGKLISFKPVLNTATFAQIKVDVATKDDVLRSVGQPYERSYLSLPQLEVWTYPYLQNDVWNSMMHIHFDKQGVVKMMQNGPDDRYERESRGLARLFRR